MRKATRRPQPAVAAAAPAIDRAFCFRTTRVSETLPYRRPDRLGAAGYHDLGAPLAAHIARPDPARVAGERAAAGTPWIRYSRTRTRRLLRDSAVDRGAGRQFFRPATNFRVGSDSR